MSTDDRPDGPGRPGEPDEPAPGATAAVVRSSAIMSIGTLASRVTGYLRSILLVSAIGLQLHADLFTVANTIPNAIYILVAGGVLNAVLVPQLVRTMRDDPDGGDAYANRVVTLVGGGLVIVSAVLVLVAPWLISLYAPGELGSPAFAAQQASLEAFARLCLPQVLFYGLYVLFGQILNARNRFGPMMFAPIANNVIACLVLGLYLVVFGPTSGSGGYTGGEELLLGLGSTLGVAAQAAVLLPALRRAGFTLRPRFDFRGTGLGRTGRLAVWTVLFVIVNQLAYLVIVRLAVGSSTGAALDGSNRGVGATVYQTASLVAMVPHSLITVSLATAALPRLARLAAEGRTSDVRRDLVSTMRLAVAGSILAGVLMLVLAIPLARLLFGWGAGAGDTEVLGITLMVFVPGMVAFTLHFLTLRGFYALEDTRTPFFVQCVVAAVNVSAALVVSWVFPYVSSVGLAASFSLAYTVGAFVSTAALARRLGGLHRVELGWFLGRATLATVPAALATLLGLVLVQAAVPGDGRLRTALALAVGGGLGAATFLATARVFRLTEVSQILDLVTARVRRRRSGGAGSARRAADPAAAPPSMGSTTSADDSATAGSATSPWTEHEPATTSWSAGPPGADTDTQAYVPETRAEDSAAGWDTGVIPVVGDALGSSVGGRPTEPVRAGAAPGDPVAPVEPRGIVASQAAEPGTLLAGRYRLDELLATNAGALTWRGTDEVLSRPVALHLLPAGDPRTDALADAARAAAGLADPHFLRMLDVSVDPADGNGLYAFVVREWVSGRNLAEALTDGPFDADDAVYVARELASAMASAHRAGLAHLRLEPDTVVLADNGQVKVVDLAVDQVLRGTSADDTTRVDTQGVGRVLYACLTARWPDGPVGGLSAAPTQDGRLCSPRQVLAGVPGPLDEVCDRILGDPPRAGRPPLATPAEVEEALDYVAGRPARRRVSMPAVPAPAVAATSAAVDPTASWRRPDTPPEPVVAPPERSTGRTFVGGAVAVVLLAGALLLGYQLAKEAFGRDDDPVTPAESTSAPGGSATTPPASATPTSGPLTIADATSYDLESTGGNGEENEELVPNAYDGDPGTAWTTVNYIDPMIDQGKQGVGLVLDLGAERTVTSVELDLLSAGGAVELRAAAAGATDVPGELGGFTVVQAVDDPADPVTITPDAPVTTRYLLVWFTALPEFDGALKGGVSDVVVLGR